jgi:hypothetical protein
MLDGAGLLDGKKDLEIIPENACALSGGRIAELGMRRLLRHEQDDVAALEPVYVQEFSVLSK